MYSTAPAPQIGDHARTPLVSSDTGGGDAGFCLLTHLHSYMHWKTNIGFLNRRKDTVNCSMCHLVAFLHSLHTPKCSFSLLFRLSWQLKVWNAGIHSFFSKNDLQCTKQTWLTTRLFHGRALLLAVWQRTKPWTPHSPCRLASATVCPFLVSMPGTSRETCSSTPWRAMARMLSSSWRWARHGDRAWNCDRKPRIRKSAAHNLDRRLAYDMPLFNTNQNSADLWSSGRTCHF